MVAVHLNNHKRNKRFASCVSFRQTAAAAFGLFIWAQMTPSASANEPIKKKSDAVRSLESILSKATEDGFLVTRPDRKNPTSNSPSSDTNQNKNASSKAALSERPSSVINCEAAKALNIETLSNISVLSDINAAKAKLGNRETADEDISNLMMTYIALDLGTEARAISSYVNSPLLSALAALVADEAEDRDITLIQNSRLCSSSFKVWDFAAHIASADPLKHKTTLENDVIKELSKFPSQIRKKLELKFAIYAAETDSFGIAEQLLREEYPETKYGDLPRRKDDDVLYLFALILQHKEDARFIEILTHLAVNDGLYKSKAIQALANDSAASGRSLPTSFESELKSINDQSGDTKAGKVAALELIKFRINKNEFNSAINTAKLKFSNDEIGKQKSVNIIGDKVSSQLKSEQPSPQLYALNGYFYDPSFFESYAHLSTLLLQVQSSSLNLGLPELALKIPTQLKDLVHAEKIDSFQNQQAYAQAEYDIKHDRYEEAVEVLEGVKSNETAKSLRASASLASGNRDLVQKVFAESKTSVSQNSDYLKFILVKGRWAEAKVFSANLTAAQSMPNETLPFALNKAELNYLAAPVIENTKTQIPNSAEDLGGYLASLKTNAQLAKGLINYASNES